MTKAGATGAPQGGLGADDLVTVRILGLPVALYQQTSEHFDGLRRELALVYRGSGDERSVPARLEQLIDELEVGFSSFTDQPTAELREAAARGDERIDLVYRLPPRAKEGVRALDALLGEADEFCRAGQHLLTVVTPPGPLAYRKWFLSEFERQLDGAGPTSWDEYAAGRSTVDQPGQGRASSAATASTDRR